MIADELKTDVSEIEPIYRITVNFAPDYNDEMVVAAWLERNEQVAMRMAKITKYIQFTGQEAKCILLYFYSKLHLRLGL